MRGDQPKQSCGCDREYRFKDITGKRFGMLTAIEPVGGTKNNGKLWKCKCDCGKYTVSPLTPLISKRTVSCGCHQKQTAKKSAVIAANHFKEKNLIEGTNIAYINRNTAIKSNTSGATGVCFNKRSNLWIAYITFKKKRHYLGYYKNINEAIAARKEAEEKYHKKFLREKGIIK